MQKWSTSSKSGPAPFDLDDDAFGVEAPRRAKHKINVPAKVKLAAAGVVLTTIGAFGAKWYFNEQGRIETVAEYNDALKGLEAGELNGGLRRLLQSRIDGFSSEAGQRPEDQDIDAILDQEAYLAVRKAIVDEWMREAKAGNFPGKEKDDVTRQRSALYVLTGWEPGKDEALGRKAMASVVDLMVAKAADSSYELVNSDDMKGGLKVVFTAGLRNLNDVRSKLQPTFAPLKAEDFHDETTMLLMPAVSAKAATNEGLIR